MRTRSKAGASKAKRKSRTARAKGEAKAFKRSKGDRSDSDRLAKLAQYVAEVSERERTSVRTTRLIGQGVPKMAQKVIEEAAEVGIEAVRGDTSALIKEH